MLLDYSGIMSQENHYQVEPSHVRDHLCRNCEADQVFHDPIALSSFPAEPPQFSPLFQEQQKMNISQVSSVFKNQFILQ